MKNRRRKNVGIWDRFEKKLLLRLDLGQKKLWNIFVFLSRFTLLAIPLHFLLWLNFDVHFLQVLTTNSVSFLLSIFGVLHRVDDVMLIVFLDDVEWTIEIIRDCVGWKSFMAVMGLIFAVRGVALDRRIQGVVIAAPAIFIGNIIRIFSSIYAAYLFGYDVFDTVHDVLWQGGLIALVIGIWWVWLEKIAYEE